MKYKAAITKQDEYALGIHNIIGFVEFSDFGEKDIEALFKINEVIKEGYKLESYISVPQSAYQEAMKAYRDNH